MKWVYEINGVNYRVTGMKDGVLTFKKMEG